MQQQTIIIRQLGVTDFEATSLAMQCFTAERTPDTADEIWLTEHPPVYTLGLNRRQVRLPARTDIPVVSTDRGGKITYHGPGQIIVYTLLDLSRRHLNIRDLVTQLEQAVVDLLAGHKIASYALKEAPGVYVRLNEMQQAKVASLGLRVKNGCCYHGLSLNVNMDLSPFSSIDPCGYVGLQVTQTKDLGVNLDNQALADQLLQKILGNLNTIPT